MERSTFARGTHGTTGNHVSTFSGMQGKQAVVSNNGGNTVGGKTFSNSNSFATGGGSFSCANCHGSSGSFGGSHVGIVHSSGGFSASHASGGFSGGHSSGGFSGGGHGGGGGRR